ncbi:MAG: ROK family protein [bacterium]
MSPILGIDIGATYIKSGLVDEKGRVNNFNKRKNRVKFGEDFLVNQIINIIHENRDRANFSKVGIAFAGRVNYGRGVILSAANMGGIHNLYLKKTLERKCEVSVMIDNDAHCFAIAESAFGAGKNYNNIIGITLGTGIGGGIIINKNLYRGADNAAGEFGHMILDMDSEIKCSCGEYGHFEALASGTALANFYKMATEQEADAELLAEMAKKGEKIAQKTIIQSGYNLAAGLSNIITIFNPEIIIIGGGLINIDLLWQTALNNFALKLSFKGLKNTKIEKSKLKDEAGVIGASLLF